MDKVISLGYGIRRQPSIGTEGELSELVNLVPKNGELVNVKPMGEINYNGYMGNLLAVHKVGGNSNYIYYTTKNLEGKGVVYDVMYTQADGLKKGSIIQTSSEVLSAVSVGNVIVVRTLDGLRYALWKDSGYKKVVNDVGFKVRVKQSGTKLGNATGSLIGDYQFNDSGKTPLDVKALNELFVEVDGVLNSAIESNEWHKYVTFGIAVLRLYDGSYAACSDVFTLDPMTSRHGLMATIKKSGDSVSVEVEQALSKYEITITSDSITEEDKDLLIGVDIFLSSPTAFVDLNSPYSVDLTNPFKLKSEEDIRKELANLQFRKSISFTVDDIVNQTGLNPTSVGDVEELLDLSSLISYTFNSDNMFAYNGRLHLGGVESKHVSMGLVKRTQPTVQYVNSVRKGYYNRVSDAYELQLPDIPTPLSNETITPNPDAPSVLFYQNKEVEAVIEVDVDDPYTGFSTNRYYTEKLSYPLPPVLSYPSMYAKEMRIYVKLGIGCYKLTKSMTASNYGNIAYTANVDSAGLGYFQVNDVTLTLDADNRVTNVTKTPRFLQWKTEGNFDEVISKAQEASTIGRRDNILKYSPSGNPFVFPSLNTVSVGEGEIRGVSSSAKALSQGQFGQFPLYAFCTDGIWALEVASDGSYSARQPISRDVCNNRKSITQIDGAVVFTTDQGLKMIQGSDVVLLSSNMDGHNVDESLYFPTDFFKSKKDVYKAYDNLVVKATDDFRVILKDCRIAYDYPNNMLRIFPSEGSKYYVYDLGTREFGSAIGEAVSEVVADYPTSLVQIGQKIYTFTNEANNTDLRYGLILTRPIDMGEPFALKKLQDMRLYYTKYNQGSMCKAVLYVSNDGIKWAEVKSLRGGSYKYFRIALITEMTDDDRLSGIALRYELNRGNKLR